MTTTITINGKATVSGKMFEPRVGAWWIEAELFAENADDPPPSGAATVNFFGVFEMVGTINPERSVNDQGKVTVRIEAGSGQLDKELGAYHFRNLTRRTLVRDLTEATGDTIDETADDGILSVRLPHWSRPDTLGHAYLSSIAEHAGAVWRVLRNGNVWVGTETWPTVSFAHTLATKIGNGNGVVIQPDAAPLARPGITFLGSRVAEVATVWTSKDLHQTVAFEDADAPGYHTRSIQREVDWLTRTIGTQLDLSALYRCRIVSQSDDLTTVDITIDSARVRAKGMQAVPVRYGVPGVKATFNNGAAAMVGWEDADPSRPYVAVAEYGSVSRIVIEPEADTEVAIAASGTGSVTITSDVAVAINAPSVELGDTPGSGVGRVGDLVSGTIQIPIVPITPLTSTMSNSGGAVLGSLTIPPFVFTGQIITGKASVKS